MPVFGADCYRGVPKLLDCALDAVDGDHVPHLGAVLDVAARGDVAGEEGEPLTKSQGGGEPDRAEGDYGEQNEHVGLEAELLRGEQRGYGDYSDEDDAPEHVRAAKARVFGLAGDELGEPSGAQHAGDQDDERHERPAREVD